MTSTTGEIQETAEIAAYRAKDALGPTFKSTAIMGGVGLFVASVQSTLTKSNIGFLGSFTRYSPTIISFAAMGGTYEFFRTAAANLREKNDSWNEAIGGFLAGSTVGLRVRTLPAVLGYGSALGIIMYAFDYTGGNFFGFPKDSSLDHYARMDAIRKNRRRPINETIEELGEGRGIYAPGYDERRQQKIKERYGIDVPAQSTHTRSV